MKLFWYYVRHSAANQIRKMLKTRVLIFLIVCAVIGIAVGTGTGMFVNAVDPREHPLNGTAGYEAAATEDNGDLRSVMQPSSDAFDSFAVRVTSLVTGLLLLGLFA